MTNLDYEAFLPIGKKYTTVGNVEFYGLKISVS